LASRIWHCIIDVDQGNGLMNVLAIHLHLKMATGVKEYFVILGMKFDQEKAE
jgi:hypothetical protein